MLARGADPGLVLRLLAAKFGHPYVIGEPLPTAALNLADDVDGTTATGVVGAYLGMNVIDVKLSRNMVPWVVCGTGGSVPDGGLRLIIETPQPSGTTGIDPAYLGLTCSNLATDQFVADLVFLGLDAKQTKKLKARLKGKKDVISIKQTLTLSDLLKDPVCQLFQNENPPDPTKLPPPTDQAKPPPDPDPTNDGVSFGDRPSQPVLDTSIWPLSFVHTTVPDPANAGKPASFPSSSGTLDPGVAAIVELLSALEGTDSKASSSGSGSSTASASAGSSVTVNVTNDSSLPAMPAATAPSSGSSTSSGGGVKVRGLGRRIVMTGKSDEIEKLRRLLATWIDIPYAQVRLDMYTFQGASSLNQTKGGNGVKGDEATLREGIQMAKTAQAFVRAQLHDYIHALDPSGIDWTVPSGSSFTGLTDVSYLLQDAGFDTNPNRGLSSADILAFLLFSQANTEVSLSRSDPTCALERFKALYKDVADPKLRLLYHRYLDALGDDTDLRFHDGKWYWRDDPFKGSLVLPGCQIKNAAGNVTYGDCTELSLDKGGLYVISAGGRTLLSGDTGYRVFFSGVPALRHLMGLFATAEVGTVGGKPVHLRAARAAVIDFCRYWILCNDLENMKAQVAKAKPAAGAKPPSPDPNLSARANDASLNYSMWNKLISQNQDYAGRLTNASSIVDGDMKQAAEALQQDLSETCMDPLIGWERENFSGSADSGIVYHGMTSLVVTSAQGAATSVTSQTYLTSQQPKNLGDVLNSFSPTGSGLGNLLGLGSGAEAVKAAAGLASALVASPPPPTFTRLAQGVSVSAVPTVLRDAGSARLQILLVVSDQPDTPSDPTKTTHVDLVNNQNLTTDVAVVESDLLELSSTDFLLSKTGSVPKLFGLKVSHPRITTSLDTIVCVQVSIVPRSLDLAGKYLN